LFQKPEKRKEKRKHYFSWVTSSTSSSALVSQNKTKIKKKENEVGWRGLGLVRGKKID
jgi:hypothetical protein